MFDSRRAQGHSAHLTNRGPGGASVWVYTGRNGSNPVWGSFTLSFRENELMHTEAHEAIAAPATTAPIRFDLPARPLRLLEHS